MGSNLYCGATLPLGDVLLGSSLMCLALVAALGPFVCLGFLGDGLALGRILEEGFAARESRTFREVFFIEFRGIALNLFCALRV